MRVSDKGLHAIAVHEGIVPAPYLDSVNIWTYGIGHAETSGLEPNPKYMPKGMPSDIDSGIQESFNLFKKKIKSYESAVNNAVKVPLDQHEFDALVGFHFNTGAISRASAIKTLNAGGDKAEVVRRLKLYNKAGGKILPGLRRRRNEEGEMFLHGTYPTGDIPVYGVTSSNKPGRIIKGIGFTEAQKFLNPTPQESLMSVIIKAIVSTFGRKR